MWCVLAHVRIPNGCVGVEEGEEISKGDGSKIQEEEMRNGPRFDLDDQDRERGHGDALRITSVTAVYKPESYIINLSALCSEGLYDTKPNQRLSVIDTVSMAPARLSVSEPVLRKDSSRGAKCMELIIL